MSGDLFVALAQQSLDNYSQTDCEAFSARYGVQLTFTEGFQPEEDQGFVPCSMNLQDGRAVDVGFEAYDTSEDNQREFSWSVSARDDDLAWVGVHIVGAYFVSQLGATLDDPQSGESWSPAQLLALDDTIKKLFDEALAG